MSDNIYTAGLGNVGSYQVAGTPYLTGSSLDSEEISFSFPTVTKKIIIENTGSNSVDFYFKESSTNLFTLPNDKKVVLFSIYLLVLLQYIYSHFSKLKILAKIQIPPSHRRG